MITRENLEGLWAAIPMAWDEAQRFDERTFRENIARLCRSGVSRFYTTGSTGEFYALDFDDFKAMVNAFLDETRRWGAQTQVGCTWFNTRDTIRRMEYAADRGADGIQVALPGWLPLTDAEVLRFFLDLNASCPKMGIVHYNTMRSKRKLSGRDYHRLAGEVPSLVGSKSGGDSISEWLDLVIHSPELRHFPAGLHFLLPAMMLGARGVYDSWVLMNPPVVLRFCALCEHRQWEEATQIEWQLGRFMIEAVIPLIEAGHLDPVLDKAFAATTGFVRENNITRLPYAPLSSEEMRALREAISRTWPEVLEVGPDRAGS
jgi:dihydrodipicolinate synthase/N-acetylneuraminate lyase